MVMHVLPPRRPQPAPVTGTFLSLAIHAALLVAVVSGSGVAGRGTSAASDAASGGADGEQLHWVGVSRGPGRGGPRARRDTRPPLAFIMPGNGGVAAEAPARPGVRDPGSGDRRAGPDRPRPLARRTAGAGDLPPALGPTELDPRESTRPREGRRGLLRWRTRDAARSRMMIPDVDATRMVAGVLSVAPDFARRVERPEDFAPSAGLKGDLLAYTEAGVFVGAAADVHVHDLPIPLVGNQPPTYPASLAREGIGGRVVVEFLIDSTGVVDVHTLHVVESSDSRFTDAVRGSLADLRFAPAQRGERAVGVTVRQPFVFVVRGGS
ncbi:hypothetical protein tb265_42330 [Gemmatimonadetes bacterium T265]|nr:hypothetical protein tb265_42330 [Gemmatimonadetes bacterium T265]